MSKKILIVDDEEDLRDALAFDFKRQGFEVFLAHNGTVAYEMFLKNPTDIVLSDVRMAGGDGVELLKNIKNSHPEVPLVLSTGFAEIGIDEAYSIGAHSVVLKPFERKYLKEVINNALLSLEERNNTDISTLVISSDLEIFESDSQYKLAFGRNGFSFNYEKSKTKDRSISKVLIHTEKFEDITIFGSVKYVLEGSSSSFNRVGIEYLKFEGKKKNEFMNWIKESKFKSSIPGI